MTEVCKGNVYLDIADEDVEKYMAKGFSVVDPKTGKILKQSIPTEIGPLKKLYSEQLKLNEALQAEIAILRNKINLLEAGVNNEATPASEDSNTWENWATEDNSKKKKSSKK